MSWDACPRLKRQEAEFEATSLLKQMDIGSLPVDPKLIAQRSQIMVRPKESNEPGVSGFLIRVGDSFGIMYATHIRNEGFIRFTIAHELGHYYIPGHPQRLFSADNNTHRSRSGFVSNDADEMQADYFAAALLMPEKLFKSALRNAGVGFGAVQSLAASCVTSITSTAIRFAEFADDPVAVLVSDGQKISYCFMSDALDGCVPRDMRYQKGRIVPPGTLTARFNQDAANVREARCAEGISSLADWFDGAPNVEMQEDVVGLGSYGRTLTVLFTEEAIDRDEREDDDE